MNFQTKVKHIKSTCEILVRDYDGDIPETVEDLCKLPGVGPKMAHLCMNIAWNKMSGIGKGVYRACAGCPIYSYVSSTIFPSCQATLMPNSNQPG